MAKCSWPYCSRTGKYIVTNDKRGIDIQLNKSMCLQHAKETFQFDIISFGDMTITIFHVEIYCQHKGKFNEDE